MQRISSTNEFLNYQDFRRFSDTFIETGSGHGDGIQRALDAGFVHIVSIEAYDENFLLCARRFAGNRKVHLYHGQSIDMLPRLFRLISGPCVFFLDAHPSAENSYGYEEAARGEHEYMQDTIIRDELKLILGDERRHIIIIDDIHGDSRGCAYEYAETIQCTKRGYSFAFYDENLSRNDPKYFYKDKLLVAAPEEA